MGNSLQITSHTNNGHYANYSYNSLGWLLSVANDNAGALTISYGYDAYGRRTSMTYPGGYVLGYQYNDGDELTALLENNTTNIISYANDNLGRVSGITRGNGVNTSASYDNVLRLMTLAQGSLNSLSLTYNQADQIKTRTNSVSTFDNIPASANDNLEF